MNFVRSLSIPKFLKIGNYEGFNVSLFGLFEEENLLFQRALILSGSGETKSYAGNILNDFIKMNKKAWLKSIRSNSSTQVEAVKKLISEYSPDILIGVGGGKVIDVAKASASGLAIPFLSVPTCLSNDGICSPVSVINYRNKVKSIGVTMPMGIVIDLDIITRSPLVHIRSGTGDLVSNMSACNDWLLAHERNGEKIDLYSEIIAKAAAVSILNCKMRDARDPEFLRMLAEGLILSGISMAVAGSSRPASGAEHLISHAIDEALDVDSRHGEQVGVATIFVETMRGHTQMAKNIRELLKRSGAPTTPSDIGINKEEFLNAVRIAPSTRKGRYTILDVIKEESELRKAYHKAFEE
jgi:glycerol-1-phosphate dehydrogenase [NAD(P)+]